MKLLTSKLSHPIFVYCTLLAITVFDFLLGPQVSTAVFYLLPVSIISLGGNTNSSLIVCLLSVFAWFCSDILSGQAYSSAWIYLWNSISRLMIFGLVAYLILNSVKKTKFYEYMANNDELTGILNRRGFMEKADEEFNRAKRFRRSFSIAFLDLDNFKSVNDNFGHQVGDTLLKSIAETIKSNIRLIDYVGRLGGDEFAIIFVETDQEGTKKAFSECHLQINELIQINDWPISFSAGVATFTGAATTLSELLEKADNWMYKVKQKGKNSVIYRHDYELN